MSIMLVILIFVPFLVGLGIMIALMKFTKDGIPWKVMTAGHKTPLVITETRDGQNLYIEKVDDPSSGLYSTDEVDYMITEGSVVNMGGIPVMRTTEDAGVGIPLKFAAYTQWLKEQKDIDDIDELRDSVLEAAKDQTAYDVSKRTDEITMADVNIDKLEGFDMQVPLGEGNPAVGVKYKDFRRFMKQNVNPALVKAKIAKRVAEIREELAGFSLDMGTGTSIMMILVGVAIVAYVVMGGGGV